MTESPLKELADQAEEALELCWHRLNDRDIDEDAIRSMIAAWRVKRQLWQQKEEEK